MRRSFRCALTAAILALFLIAPAGAVTPDAFAKLPDFEGAQLSPQGDRLLDEHARAAE